MLFARPLPEPDPLRAAVRACHRMDEARCVEERLAEAVNSAIRRRSTKPYLLEKLEWRMIHY